MTFHASHALRTRHDAEYLSDLQLVELGCHLAERSFVEVPVGFGAIMPRRARQLRDRAAKIYRRIFVRRHDKLALRIATYRNVTGMLAQEGVVSEPGLPAATIRSQAAASPGGEFGKTGSSCAITGDRGSGYFNFQQLCPDPLDQALDAPEAYQWSVLRGQPLLNRESLQCRIDC